MLGDTPTAPANGEAKTEVLAIYSRSWSKGSKSAMADHPGPANCGPGGDRGSYFFSRGATQAVQQAANDATMRAQTATEAAQTSTADANAAKAQLVTTHKALTEVAGAMDKTRGIRSKTAARRSSRRSG